MVKSYLALMLSAFYWRYRRQKESHSLSIFWVAMVFGLLFPMWLLLVISILFQKVDALQIFRPTVSRIQTPLLFLSWVAGWWAIHKFMLLNPSIHTEELTPEGYRSGNIYAVLFLAFSVGAFGYTLISLGNM